jgi:hypothetical protein
VNTGIPKVGAALPLPTLVMAPDKEIKSKGVGMTAEQEFACLATSTREL